MKLKTLKFCLVMAGFTAASHGALSFSENFTGGLTAPMTLGAGYGSPVSNFTNAFNITSGDGNRTYLGTNDTDYALQDFTFEADVTFTSITSAWSIVFLGMGNRDAGGSSLYGEPLTGGAYLLSVVRPDEGLGDPNSPSFIPGNLQTRNSTVATGNAAVGIGLTAGSTHGVRMEWTASSRTAKFLFDLGNDGTYDPALTYSSAVTAGTFTGTNSQLVLGGGNGLVFDNIVVSTIPEPTAALLGGLGVLALLRRRRN